jgi:Rrf2 family protein
MRLELTRRADYAIRTVIFLARRGRRDPTPGPRVASQMGIPARFLPHVMGDLTRAGIVEAEVGRGGGYRLARDPRGLSLLEVIEAVEGDPRRRSCVLRTGGCDPDHPCDVHPVFSAAQDAFLERLAGTSIADVIAGPEPTGRRRLREVVSAR